MGKTFKDQANYHRFKGSLDDAPEHLREKGELMERHYKGYCSGDDRKGDARSKVIERRLELVH